MKQVSTKIDAAKAPLDKEIARAVTPRKAEPANNAPNTFEAPKVEATPVAKQATLAKQWEPGPGPGLASVPPVAQKTDKAKKAKTKQVAPPLVPDHSTRSSERYNKGVPPPWLGFQSAILIIALIPIRFGTAVGHDVINLPVYGAVAEICEKVVICQKTVHLFNNHAPENSSKEYYKYLKLLWLGSLYNKRRNREATYTFLDKYKLFQLQLHALKIIKANSVDVYKY